MTANTTHPCNIIIFILISRLNLTHKYHVVQYLTVVGNSSLVQRTSTAKDPVMASFPTKLKQMIAKSLSTIMIKAMNKKNIALLSRRGVVSCTINIKDKWFMSTISNLLECLLEKLQLLVVHQQEYDTPKEGFSSQLYNIKICTE